MSIPQDGGIPSAEGVARKKKRRRRRSKNRQEAGHETLKRAAASRNADDPGNHPADKARGQSSNVPAGEGSVRSFRKRKRGKRNSQHVSDRELRNLRPPVVPVPDARFEPAASQEKRGDTNPKSSSHGEKKGRRGSMHQREVFAALDLGTNNCRLLIASPREPGRFRVIDSFSRIIRLGEGLGATGRLSEDAMERAIEALSICAAKLRSRQIAGQRLIATEACRRAANGETFLRTVRERTGLELEVVNRETEARLAAEGCGALMDRQADGAVLFDIGGGSSELILVNRRATKSRWISRQITGWTSLPLGVVTLAERHGGKEVSKDLFETMVAEVLSHLNQFEQRHGLADIWGNGRTHLLGTSGTVTTIAGVHLGLARYDRRKVDGIWLSEQQIDAVVNRLLEMDYENRSLNPCIGKERADLVLAGCAILQAIRITWPSDRLRVADRGLREGILNQLMHKSGAWSRSGRKRHRNRERGADHTRRDSHSERAK